jgi:hypothetical protein
MVAYRVGSMVLDNPHVYFALPPFVACQDVTNQAPFGQGSVNQRINDALTKDPGTGQGATMPTGFLGASMLLVFGEFDPKAAQVPATLNAGKCTAPLAGTSCSYSGQLINVTVVNKSSGSCLTIPPNTINPTYGTLQTPSAPCAVVNVGDLSIQPLLGIPMTIRNASITFTYVEAGKTLSGIMTGDLKTDEAAMTQVDLGLGKGPQPVSSLFAGGQGSCTTTVDDRDQASNRTLWKFFLSVTAQTVLFKN